MKTIAISGWLAYAPFRGVKSELQDIGVRLLDRISDRVEGLKDGRYTAATLSNYHLVEALDTLGDSVGVSWACVEPVDYGSDRIVVRNTIKTTNDLYHSRIGLCAQGLEINLFEHLFDTIGLPPKNDYIFLADRSTYIPAFRDGYIDAVMTPQPDRSKLLRDVPDAKIFNGDEGLPRFGLYAVLVYRKSDIDYELLKRMQDIVYSRAIVLANLDDTELKSAHPSSFEGIDKPVEEIKTTLRWLSPAESNKYLRGTGEKSFQNHLGQIADLRVRRFNLPPINILRIAALVN